MEKKLYTVTVYSENHVGLLNQVTIIFTQRQLNIETLCTAPSAREGIHKLTITAESDSVTIANIVKQIEKSVDVIRAFYYDASEVISQELALYKVPTPKLLAEGGIEQIVSSFNLRILEINDTFTVIEKSGDRAKIDELFESLNSRYGVLQFVRSGKVTLTRSKVEEVSLFIDEQEQRRLKLEKN